MPDWLIKEDYPFAPHYFNTPAGKIHYIDEGSDRPVVMVHGNPLWSFSYRHLVKKMRETCRCVAPDHIGFGLSDKPQDWEYTPRQHAENLASLIKTLDLKDITLIVSDWGGPIGLYYALNRPDNIKNIILFNTWMWPVHKDWYYWIFSKSAAGTAGSFLIERFNLFARIILKLVYAQKSRLRPHIQQHYLKPLDTPARRKPTWIFPQHLLVSTEWLEKLWSQVDKIRHKPVLILWGMKDPAFRKKELKKWTNTLTNFKLCKLPDAGHLPHEEKPERITSEILDFLLTARKQKA